METGFAQPVPPDQLQKIVRFLQKPLTIGHDHGVQTDSERVGNDVAQLLHREQGYFPGRDLDLAAIAQVLPQGIELRFGFLEGRRSRVVGKLA